MFKYKCFIRKNNEFLRNTLKRLGYVEQGRTSNEVLIATNDGHDTSYYTTIPESSISNLGCMFIDCYKSETLFLGVAAITDEHDKFQFFKTLTDQSWVNLGYYSPKGSFEFCLVSDRHMGRNPLFDSITVPAVKATVEEIVEKFKDCEEDTDFFSKITEENWKKNVYDFEHYPLTDEEKEMLAQWMETEDDNKQADMDTYTASTATIEDNEIY